MQIDIVGAVGVVRHHLMLGNKQQETVILHLNCNPACASNGPTLIGVVGFSDQNRRHTEGLGLLDI